MAEDFDLLDNMEEIIEDFLVEADELINSLDENLVLLENDRENIDLLNEIFRAAHTIKGSSGFLGFDQVIALTHRMEDVLNKLRKKEIKVTPEIMDVLLQSLDVLKQLIANIREKVTDKVDLSHIINQFQAILDEEKYSGEASNRLSPEKQEQKPSSPPSEVKTESANASEDNIEKTGPAEPKSQVSSSTKGQTIRVDVKRLDHLMNLLGELVLGRNSMTQTVGELVQTHQRDKAVEQLEATSNAINLITTELQTAAMKMRMQPVSKVFKKFPRLIRDLSRDTGKKIQLEITGETTELDKSVIEQIGDPLVHILRNSCDHGIESPEDRIKAGKPECGTIRLSAHQEGSRIVITISDDGRGLDVERIRKKAIERGLVDAATAELLNDKEILGFIFEAGFSTAKKVTGISGRGVGMDVVRTNIKKLNGVVELSTNFGQGATLYIMLPLTLAIVQGLIVESDTETFVLPLVSVRETVQTSTADISYMNKRPVLRLRDEVIPLLHINLVLQKRHDRFVVAEKEYIVIVNHGDKKLGLLIDSFHGQEEVVIKPMDSYLNNCEGVSGATILGDGRIRLIIDIAGLFDIARSMR